MGGRRTRAAVRRRVLTGYRKGEGYRVDTPALPGRLHDHLKLMHGVWTGDVDTMAELVECHESLGPGDDGYIPHTHRPPQPVEEWDW